MTISKILNLLGVLVHVSNPRLDSLILGQKNQELKITSTTLGVQGSPELSPITWNNCCLTHGDIDKRRKGIAQTTPISFPSLLLHFPICFSYVNIHTFLWF